MAGHHSATAAPRLQMRHITKRFLATVANDDINLDVQAGEIHALLGENGAGKTTLMRILYGLYQADVGDIVIDQQPAHITSPRQAIAAGIALVPQHFLLVRHHTVAENIALGLPGVAFFQPLRRLEERLRTIADQYDLVVDPQAHVWQLSPGEQQRVEIVKALLRGSTILILDEPTGLLTPQEIQALFRVLKRLQNAGHCIVFITHKLREVLEIANQITVLRRGRVVANLPTSATDETALARLMVGRDINKARLPRHATPVEAILTITNLWANNDRGQPALRGLSFTVHGGEILGVVGVAGNGQEELVEVVTGLRQPTAGQIQVGGQVCQHHTARLRREMRMAHIPADRYHMGLVPAMSVAENLILDHYRYLPFRRGWFLDRQAIAHFAEQAIATHGIVTPGPATPAGLLSGGNMQKLILARELSTRPRVIVAVHPTHGLDVGATEQTHERLLQQRQQGAAILLVSEELDEVIQLADRILVLCGGVPTGILAAATADRQRLGLLMAGVRSA